MLSTFPELEIQKVIHSVEDGLQWLSENEHPKLIFSDIVLGDGLSFDIFEKIPTKSFYYLYNCFWSIYIEGIQTK